MPFYKQCLDYNRWRLIDLMKHAEEPRLFRYRIKYQMNESVGTNYHYYMACTADQALHFQKIMAGRRGWELTTLSVERRCPWSEKWIDESHVVQLDG